MTFPNIITHYFEKSTIIFRVFFETFFTFSLNFLQFGWNSGNPFFLNRIPRKFHQNQMKKKGWLVNNGLTWKKWLIWDIFGLLRLKSTKIHWIYSQSVSFSTWDVLHASKHSCIIWWFKSSECCAQYFLSALVIHIVYLICIQYNKDRKSHHWAQLWENDRDKNNEFFLLLLFHRSNYNNIAMRITSRVPYCPLTTFFYMCVCLLFCSIATPLLATFSVSVVVVLHLYSNLNHIFFIKLWQMDKKWKTRGKKKTSTHTHSQQNKHRMSKCRQQAAIKLNQRVQYSTVCIYVVVCM